jgi:hypothetical protein
MQRDLLAVRRVPGVQQECQTERQQFNPRKPEDQTRTHLPEPESDAQRHHTERTIHPAQLGGGDGAVAPEPPINARPGNIGELEGWI